MSTPSDSEDSSQDTNSYEINCGEVMDINSIAEVHIQFVEALESGQPVVLNAKQVERADTSALQLLSTFFHDAIAQKQSVQWIEPSDSLCRSAALLGLSDLLNLNVNTQ
ncbi:MAG: STAS domain-containing protein [Ectothiorhodospiraceae bacterium]|nr:STAS domain-containing protein [Ectothiorhodospiraceae bacterium]